MARRIEEFLHAAERIRNGFDPARPATAAVMRTPAGQPGARPSRERPISGNRPDEVNVADGSISIIRRVDLNDRDVSEGSDHAAALGAPFVAVADIRTLHPHRPPDSQGVAPRNERRIGGARSL
jgi:hypothetical protein